MLIIFLPIKCMGQQEGRAEKSGEAILVYDSFARILNEDLRFKIFEENFLDYPKISDDLKDFPVNLPQARVLALTFLQDIDKEFKDFSLLEISLSRVGKHWIWLVVFEDNNGPITSTKARIRVPVLINGKIPQLERTSASKRLE